MNPPPWTISVIIPTYNRASLLVRASESVQNQTLTPLEVIVVDDGSTDNTSEIVARNYSHFRYIYQRRRGVSAARNLGINNAKSQWIAFLDSDDEWLPDKLATQIKTLTTQSQYVICHTEEIWIRNGKRVNPMKKHKKYGGFIFKECLPLCLISPSSVIINKDVFKIVGCFDESLPACEDYELWLRICTKYPVLFLKTPLIIKYGGHNDQLSRKYWGMDRFRIKALENIIRNHELNIDDYHAAIKTLIQKIDIYNMGARKRGRNDDVLYYEQKKLKYLNAANERLSFY